MTTTGHILISHISAMFSGWEEVEEGEMADWEKHENDRILPRNAKSRSAWWQPRFCTYLSMGGANLCTRTYPDRLACMAGNGQKIQQRNSLQDQADIESLLSDLYEFNRKLKLYKLR
ncbi:MAG: hypothetical protein RBR38_09780 [Desulfomicrobium apsheronum]|nr:hypothetical protein [Desulfomicrobium apsheronum]